MKKYTNKILIIATALLIVVTTVLFFIEAVKIKREHPSVELIINQ